MAKQKCQISRRDTLRLMSAAGFTALVAYSGEPVLRLASRRSGGSTVRAQTLSCVGKPQLTEGPYFVDERLNRSDIRTDPVTNAVSEGLPFVLTINVSRVSGSSCTALQGAYVDIWHCDAAGTYSDVRDAGFDTRGRKYLRGYQVTDTNGAVVFQTIYPGWYSGRTVHIHFKIRMFADAQTTYEYTSQLFFDDAFTDQVYTQSPYSAKGIRNTRNNQDGIYNGGGSQLLLNVAQTAQGFAATFNIGLEGVPDSDPSAPAPEIIGATVSGKQLIVTGRNFDSGAILFIDGERQKKTGNDETNPTTVLIARKSAKWITAGQTVKLQVRNSDNTLSNEFSYTRPVE
ncbi:MAG TPA: intradiol ring-cleavage dioxygenase [Blastocatellia bacterium]|nr:intradiol ring-cleavage dioxygenase [Blastocatellia bacterium]